MITYVQLFIFISFITYIISRFGVLNSISESWYKLEENKKGMGILFTAFLWAIGFLMFFQTNGSSGFFFASGAGLIAVGTATQYKQKMTSTVHFAGAFSGLLFPLIAVWYERGLWYPLAAGVLFYILSLIFDIKKETLWLEIVMVILILVGLTL